MNEEEKLFVLYEIATMLYENDISCEVESHPQTCINGFPMGVMQFVSYKAIRRPTGGTTYGSLSIYCDEIRFEHYRIKLASPTAFEEVLYYLKNDVSIAEET